MEVENESRKQMKSRLYSLLADKRKKDRLSDYNALYYEKKIIKYINFRGRETFLGLIKLIKNKQPNNKP